VREKGKDCEGEAEWMYTACMFQGSIMNPTKKKERGMNRN
jgi:hypothetical protein